MTARVSMTARVLNRCGLRELPRGGSALLCGWLLFVVIAGCGQNATTSPIEGDRASADRQAEVTSHGANASVASSLSGVTATVPDGAVSEWLENPGEMALTGRFGRRLQVVWKEAGSNETGREDADSEAELDSNAPAGTMTGRDKTDVAFGEAEMSAVAGEKESMKSAQQADQGSGEVSDEKSTSAEASMQPPADWYVLIDGEPVRDEAGILLSVPCEVRVPPGLHEVTLAQPNFADLSKKVEIRQDRKVSFDFPVQAERGDSSLSGPLFDLAKGEFLPLDEINTAGKEYDPWLSADGRTLIFAGDRAEGRGLYMAIRPTRFHNFPPAQLIEITRSGEFAATPVLSPDGLSLMYVHPARTRMWVLERNSVDEPFLKRTALRSIDQPGVEWVGAQLVFPDATSLSPQMKASESFQLVWIERNADGQERLLVAEGPTLGSLSKAQAKPVLLPGGRPWFTISTDRQFGLDGNILQRFSREKSASPLAAARYGNVGPIGQFPQGFPPILKTERSPFIADDEQWLVAAVTSAASDLTIQDQLGDLMILRLADGPQWGWSYQGKSLKPKPSDASTSAAIVAENSPTKAMNTENGSSETGGESSANRPAMVESSGGPDAKPPIIAGEKTSPVIEVKTAYTEYQKSFGAFQKALQTRDYASAQAILDERQAAEFSQPLGQLTELDLEWLRKLKEFQAMVNDGVNQLEPGTTVRVGSAKLELIGLKEGVLSLKSRLKTIEKPLWELSTGDLLALAESLPGGANQAAALKSLAFVKADPILPARVVDLWLGRAGPGGQDFLETFSTRELEEGRLALAENRLSSAVEHFGKTIAAGPDQPAAQAAEKEKAQLYDRTRWKVVGKRDWSRGPDGEWSADAKRIDGAYLVSESDYENFVCEFEWKADQPGAQGGLYFHYAGEGNPFDFGYKIQLAGDMDQQGLDQYSTGALFGSDAPKKKVAKKNAWNRFRLTVIGPKTTVQINDEVVLETDVPVSKGEPRGYLAIDGVGGAFRYRKILVYEPSHSPAAKPQN